ncbi:MAG: DUF4445 domain-containing protein, partial [Gemmatimonadetes bacterium]|nr:DUF4445 domain-containing protein [Gemmatimonadota bacterium]
MPRTRSSARSSSWGARPVRRRRGHRPVPIVSFVLRFLPDGCQWRGEQPSPLAIAAAECGILLEQPCGGKAVCGKCRVRVADGHLAPDPADLRVLGGSAVEAGWRLACRATVSSDAQLEVPPASRTVARKSFGPDSLLAESMEPGNPVGGWAIALVLGSTTLAAALVDLATGAVAATASALNPQVHYGGDVISRIAFARAHEHGSRELHRLMLAGVDGLVGQCAAALGIDRSELRALAAAGNPTMTHTLLGLGVHGLGEAPFQGERYEAWAGAAAALGLQLPERTEAWVLPGVGTHVGGDAVAAIIATGLALSERPRLLIDLGTNTEVVLGSRHGIVCTSAAAGPAFEGSVIRYGMRAVPGAIDRITLGEEDLQVTVLGGEPEVGICGSGLIDAVATLLQAGVIEPSGRLRPHDELQGVPAALGARVTEAEGERAVRLGGTDARPVYLTAADIRELQLVKASIAAAVQLLLERAGTRAEDVAEVCVAGAFGATIRAASARAIGLLPLPDCPVAFVGNAAGAGARTRRAEGSADGAGHAHLRHVFGARPGPLQPQQH